jgi:hypothetical protein
MERIEYTTFIPMPNVRFNGSGMGRNLDVQSVDVGKASKEACQHLDLGEDTEIHCQGQYLEAWNHSACASSHCVRLQCGAPR